jgi:hypothetical protein
MSTQRQPSEKNVNQQRKLIEDQSITDPSPHKSNQQPAAIKKPPTGGLDDHVPGK